MIGITANLALLEERLIHLTQSDNNNLNDVEVQTLKLIKEAVKIELIGQVQSESLDKLKHLVEAEKLICKKAIKCLKTATIDQICEKQLAKLRGLKKELNQLEQSIREQQELLQNREKIHLTRSWSQEASFNELLQEVQEGYPQLKDDCHFLKEILQIHMRMKEGALLPQDAIKLKEFSSLARPLAPDLADLADHEAATIEQAFISKRSLLTELSASLNPEPFDNWSDAEKMELFVKAQQILSHPYEPPLSTLDFLDWVQKDSHDQKLKELCQVLKAELNASSKEDKRDFWDFVPPLEKRAHLLAQTQEKKELLYQYKMEGLRHILASIKPTAEDQEGLIIGGGPGGLIHALALTFSGHACRVVEKRESHKQNRSNVITLGKNNPKDLSILFFFGVVSALDKDEKVSFGHLKPKLMEVRIGDLEQALKRTLNDLQLLDRVQFGKQVVALERVDQKARVVIVDAKNPSQQEVVNPSFLIVTDGAASPTRKMLGISKTVVAQTTQIAYSILKQDQVQTTPKALKYRIQNFLKGVILSISLLINRLIFYESMEEAFGHTIEGGPTAIFRIPRHDYLIRCLREHEQTRINTYRHQIANLDAKIANLPAKIADLNAKIKEWESQKDLSSSEQAKLDILIQKRSTLIQKQNTLIQTRNHFKDELESYLTHQGEKMHGLLDILSSFYSKKHHVQKMSVEKNYLVDIVVGKAERDFLHVGETPVMLRGDASHTTDPYSGYGCKTAIEETLADQFSFSYSLSDKLNPLKQACQRWGHQHYQYSMINQGLRERSLYRSNTELLERYTDLAIRNGFLTEQESFLVQRLVAKAEQGIDNPFITYSAEEKKLAGTLEERFRAVLKSYVEDPSWDWKNLDQKWQHPLSPKEKKLFRKLINRLIKPSEKLPSSKQTGPLLAKMAYEDLEAAPLIALLLQINSINLY